MLYALIAAGVSVLASMLLDMLGFERHIIDSKEVKQRSCGTGCDATASEPASVREGANKSPNIKMRPCKYLNLMN